MKLPIPNSFVVGFASALILMAAIWVWQHFGMRGGVIVNSPDGVYSLSVMAALSPAFGGTYEITLRDFAASTVLRRLTLEVPGNEQTVALREGGGSVVWDPSSKFADCLISGRETVRIWVP